MRLQKPSNVDRLYREHGPMVYRRAMRMLGNRADAEEALQEVFMRVLSSEAIHDGTGDLIGWLYRVTTNYCLNRIRDQARRRELTQTQVAPHVQTWTVSTPVDLLTMRWLLARGDDRQAQAAIYVYLDGLSYDEAAPLLGVSRSTVGNLVERFQLFCAEQLKLNLAGSTEARSPQSQTTELP